MATTSSGEIRIIHFSWNSLSKYLHCPRQYKFFIDKVESARDSRNAILGIVIQRLFEHWMNDGFFWEKSQWLYTNFDKFWDEGCERNHCAWENKDQELKTKEDAREQIQHMFNMIVKYRLLSKKMKSEFRFCAKLTDEVEIGGSIDFLIERPDAKFVLDAKGTRYKNKYLEPRQLIYYKLGMITQFGPEWQDAETAFLIYRNELWEQVYSGQDTIEEMRALVLDIARKVVSGQFECKPSKPVCRFCDWQDRCEYFNQPGRNDDLFT